tara:strand:+ start:9039 stop:10238 length:1200 start_codon:yes stop_codon:yes gene_type:complete
MSIKKIAFLSIHSCPVANPDEQNVGGMNVYVRNIALFLGKLGIKVDIYTRVHDDKDPIIVSVSENVRVIHIRLGPPDVNKKELINYLGDYFDEIKKFIDSQEVKYSLIHSHYWLSGIMGSKLSKYLNLSHFVTFHTFAQIKNRYLIDDDDAPSRLSNEMELIVSADKIICSSESEKKELMLFSKGIDKKFYCIGGGVDTKKFSVMNQIESKEILQINNNRVILFVGRIEPFKGIDLLIESISNVEKIGTGEAKLFIAGKWTDRQYLDSIKAKIKELKLSEAVNFIGPIKHNQMPLYYNAADLTVIPSFHESCGLVALESMACGTPVVASQTGGLVENVLDGITGYLISLRSSKLYAEKIDVLLNQDSLRLKMGFNGVEKVKNMSWDIVSKKMLKSYNEC